MARPQPNALPPFSATFPSSTEAAPSTITRSMSRKTLVSSRPSTSNTPAAGMPRSRSGLPRARPSLDLSAVASTSTSTTSSVGLPRSRTSSSLTSRGSAAAHKTASTTTRRRVLGEAKNTGSSTSELGVMRGTKVTGTRRLGKVEAGALTGMGVVRTGPAVIAPRSPSRQLRQGSSTDPFSTSFKAPTFTFSSPDGQQARSPEKAHATGDYGARKLAKLPSSPVRSAAGSATSILPGPFDLTSPRKIEAPRSPTKRPHLSPSRRRLFGAGENSPGIPLHDSPPVRRPAQGDEMDVDHTSILSSSPFPQSRTPRELAKRNEESSEDELDFLSPRKKKRSASVSTIREDPPSTITGIRSPPKKKVATASRQGPLSVPMARSAAIRDPSAEAPSVPPTAPAVSTALTRAALAPSIRPSSLMSKFAPRPSTAPQPQPSPSTFGYQAPTASTASKTQGAALSAVQLAQHQAQAIRAASASSSGIPRLAAVGSLPRSSTLTMLSAMEVDSSSASEAVDRSLFEERSINTTITDIEEEDEEGDSNTSSMTGNVSICSTSDGTSKRLANLQSMLSRLQMPRQSSGSSRSSLGGSASTLKKEKTLTGAFQEEYTVPLAPVDKPRGGIPRSRASLSSVSSSLTAKVDGQLSNITPGRRRHSISTRPSTSSSSSTRPPPPSTASQPNTRPPRRTSNVLPTSSSTATIAALTDSELSAQPKSYALRGVVAFVDVRTGDGDDASAIFVDMLKSMGARVTTRPTSTLTHIIYKTGRPGTLSYYRTQPDPKPHLIGISWVVRCAELGQRVDEVPYLIQCAQEPTFQKRRRSMEPKALVALSANTSGSSAGLNPAMSADSAVKATIAASIERARRKSLQFAPKVGSPLAKRVFVMPVDRPEEDGDEDMF